MSRSQSREGRKLIWLAALAVAAGVAAPAIPSSGEKIESFVPPGFHVLTQKEADFAVKPLVLLEEAKFD